MATEAKTSSTNAKKQDNPNKCLFLFNEKGKPNLYQILKKKGLNPVYNGVGTFIEYKHKDAIEQIRNETGVRLLEWPLDSSFEDLKKNNYLDFFRENEAKLSLRIEALKSKMGYASLQDSWFLEEENKKNLLATSQGKELIDCFKERDKIRDRIQCAEIEERLLKLELSQEKGNFYDRLGRIIGDTDFAKKLKGREYEIFENEHKRIFSRGGLITGNENIDEKLSFYRGDFIVVQGMSNHGKSSLKLQLVSRFLTEKENQKQNPMCIFITYESSPISVETKFLNLLGHELQEGTVILYDRKYEDRYLYPDKKKFKNTITTYNKFLMENRIVFLKSVKFEKLGILVDHYKAEFPDRTIVLILDYFQIIDSDSTQTGWEKVKDISYGLEKIAIEKEIIIITGSQVNENRQTREGRDIYSAATTVLDIFNHSHEALNTNKEHQKEFKAKISNKNVCTFSAIKQKHGESFTLKDCFLFNGFHFENHRHENNISKKSETHNY